MTESVLNHYGAIARSLTEPKYATSVANAFGYTDEELFAIPTDANLGLSCGNPVATANIARGESVVDLGCGGGLDVFLAANKVGPDGKVVGVDMNEDMLALARRNAAKSKSYVENVEFVHSEISNLKLASNFANVIISNCVLNLIPDDLKPKAFGEIFRVLKPGGRLAVSDIVAYKELPPHIKSDLASYVGCISGALELSKYRTELDRCGFENVTFLDKKADLNVYKQVENNSSISCCSKPSGPGDADAENRSTSCCSKSSDAGETKAESNSTRCCSMPSDPSETQATASFVGMELGYDINEWAGSFYIFALKPASVSSN